MEVISENARIYRISAEELTMGQIREYFRDWGNNDHLGGLMVFYDYGCDKVFIGPGARQEQIKFCVNALEKPCKVLGELIYLSRKFDMECNRTIARILIQVIRRRFPHMQINVTFSVQGPSSKRR